MLHSYQDKQFPSTEDGVSAKQVDGRERRGPFIALGGALIITHCRVCKIFDL